jgi:hypothetical protein
MKRCNHYIIIILLITIRIYYDEYDYRAEGIILLIIIIYYYSYDYRAELSSTQLMGGRRGTIT